MHSSHFLRYESKIIFIVEVEVMKLDITYDENILTADNIILFQRKMGWTEEPKDQLTKSLSNTLFLVVSKKDDEIIGMGRLLGDAAMYWYINDVFILTEYQGLGIGKEIVKRLVQYAKQNSLSGTSISLCLISAQGKTSFINRIEKSPYALLAEFYKKVRLPGVTKSWIGFTAKMDDDKEFEFGTNDEFDYESRKIAG
jgi:GNAT superfamily N-acetyltransferase